MSAGAMAGARCCEMVFCLLLHRLRFKYYIVNGTLSVAKHLNAVLKRHYRTKFLLGERH
jgi:hypothetical protein